MNLKLITVNLKLTVSSIKYSKKPSYKSQRTNFGLNQKCYLKQNGSQLKK